MAHQTGIRPTMDLIAVFRDSGDAVRSIKAVITGEDVVHAETGASSASWEDGEFRLTCLYRREPKCDGSGQEMVAQSCVCVFFCNSHSAFRFLNSDYTAMTKWLGESDPCFILFRLDSKLPSGDPAWLLIQCEYEDPLYHISDTRF
jgi:hypothetical protein